MAIATSINRKSVDILVVEASLSPRDKRENDVERKNDCPYM